MDITGIAKAIRRAARSHRRRHSRRAGSCLVPSGRR